MVTLLIPLTFLAVALAAIGVGIYIWRLEKNRAALTEQKAAPQQARAAATPPPESKFVTVDGTRLHYIQAGQGPDLVLIHGIGASLFIWRFLFPLLQTHYRVTALDLAGFGKSDKDIKRDYGLDMQTDLLTDLLIQIGIRKALLVGSSMGGAISLWAAKKYPDRFPKIAVLAPATDSSLVPASVQAFAGAAPFFRKALNRRTMKLILSRVVSRHELITDEAVDAYLEPFLDRGESLRVFWSALNLLSDKRLPKDLNGLKTQTLIIYGERDLMVPRRSMNHLKELLPKSTLLIHREGGHHLMEDEPAWLAQELTKFFSAR
jgi:pimeloyl-ACP methyl ester carboxylesterase